MKRLFLSVVSIITIGFLLLTQTACKNNNECNIAAPTGVKFSTITSLGVSISWGAVSGAFNYQVELLDSLSNAIVESKTASATETGFSKLTADKAYKVKITARCSKDQLSTKMAMGNFHTPKEPCNLPAVSNLTAIANPTKVTVNFALLADAISYKVDIYTANPKVFLETKTVVKGPVIFTGLIPATGYIVEAAAICKNNVQSPNIARKSFVTPFIIEDDIMMFVKQDPQFQSICTSTKSNAASTTSLRVFSLMNGTTPYTGMIHFIKIVKGNTIVSEFRLANYYSASMDIMKFCYKDLCADTPILQEPLKDATGGFLKFDLGNGDSMNLTPTQRDFTIDITPSGSSYTLSIDKVSW